MSSILPGLHYDLSKEGDYKTREGIIKKLYHLIPTLILCEINPILNWIDYLKKYDKYLPGVVDTEQNISFLQSMIDKFGCKCDKQIPHILGLLVSMYRCMLRIIERDNYKTPAKQMAIQDLRDYCLQTENAVFEFAVRRKLPLEQFGFQRNKVGRKPAKIKTCDIAQTLYKIACEHKGIQLERPEAFELIHSKEFPNIYSEATGTQIPKKTLDTARKWKQSSFIRLLNKSKQPNPERVSKDTAFANGLNLVKGPNQETKIKGGLTPEEESLEKQANAILKRKK